jgi:hypothetical protein
MSEDAICLGTDPSELWNKQQMTEMWTQMLADSAPKVNNIVERKIIVVADGNSAAVVDQYIMPDISPNIPWRNVYHLVKTNGNWKIFFFNCGFIPKNEEIQKLNDALK